MFYLETLDSELERFQIEVNREHKLALAHYCHELAKWNERINLTALCGRRMVRRLVAEPAWIARHVPLHGRLLDVGSGNGSPAVPFHVLCRFRACDLVEARTKRAAFLRHIAAQLKLKNVRIHRGRFEQLAATLPAPDWVSVQGVALTDNLVSWIRNIAAPSTKIIWITSSQSRPKTIAPAVTLTVPITGTKVLLFDLDLS